ncbi:MAG: glycosyltransferase family 39 protein [Chloroflexi bacterium]|nr:glycosyltransferase family 39 protein [Chloroflexota bacterium]
MRKRDLFLLLCILALGIFLRASFLGSPPEPVFDEVDYFSMTFNLSQGIKPHIVHPPLGVVLLTVGSKIFGSSPEGMRYLPFICGVLSLLLVYLIGRKLFGDRAGIYAALLMACDPLQLVFSRLAMLDILLTVFLLGALYSYIAGRKGICGILLGAALLIKWNALFAVAGFIIWDLWINRKNPAVLRIVKACLLIFLPLVFYYLGFSIYLGSSSITDFIAAQGAMLKYHENTLPGILPFSSPAWSWFIVPQSLPVYQAEMPGFKGSIIFANNPVFIWPAVAAFIFFALRWLKEKTDPAGILLFLTIALYGSWFLVSRALYLYYILPVLPLLALLLGDFLARLESEKSGRWAVVLYLALLVISLIFYLPQLRVLPS